MPSDFLQSNTPYRGQALAEYGLLIGLLCVLCLGGLTMLGQSLTGLFDRTDNQIGQQVTAHLQNASSGGNASNPVNGNKLIVNTDNSQTGIGSTPNSGTPIAVNPQTGTIVPTVINKVSPTVLPNTASDGHSVSTTPSNPTLKVKQTSSP